MTRPAEAGVPYPGRGLSGDLHLHSRSGVVVDSCQRLTQLPSPRRTKPGSHPTSRLSIPKAVEADRPHQEHIGGVRLTAQPIEAATDVLLVESTGIAPVSDQVFRHPNYDDVSYVPGRFPAVNITGTFCQNYFHSRYCLRRWRFHPRSRRKVRSSQAVGRAARLRAPRTLIPYSIASSS